MFVPSATRASRSSKLRFLLSRSDRLARNLAYRVAIRSYLAKLDIRLVSMSEQLDESTSGQLIEHITDSLAEFYSANLAGEVRKGLTQRVKQGGWPRHVHTREDKANRRALGALSSCALTLGLRLRQIILKMSPPTGRLAVICMPGPLLLDVCGT